VEEQRMRRLFVDLLGRMLRWDPEERIAPEDTL
jgi:hypothetical protein